MQINGSDRRLMWHGAILFLLAVFSGWLMCWHPSETHA
jgi:hypothetical protein